MSRRDTSPEAMANAYIARVGARRLYAVDLASVIGAERARVRRIVRRECARFRENGVVSPTYVRDHILAALREGKGTR